MTPARWLVFVFLALFVPGAQGTIINVNCVGDSITAGVGVTQASVDSYPAKLQQLMGAAYAVGNFGFSGATLLTNGDIPYRSTSEYIPSKSKPFPNILVILLGTNDSKPQNWAYGTNFLANYIDLLASYTNAAIHPRILICTPPPVFNDGYALINPGIVATNIAPLIRALGTNSGLQVIDFQSLLAGHAEWFPDNVHPNAQGTSVMAAIVYTALLGDTLNGTVPSVQISPVTATTATLAWPAAGAGWVLQSTPALGGSNSWVVVGQRAINNGTTVGMTTNLTGVGALYRLWEPGR